MRNRVIIISLKTSRKQVVFWRVLWEGNNDRNAQVNSNIKADWLEEVRGVMKEVVPELPTEGFQLDRKDARKIISKKNNWSASGPDDITNFWWKKVHVLQEGVARRFLRVLYINWSSYCGLRETRPI